MAEDDAIKQVPLGSLRLCWFKVYVLQAVDDADCEADGGNRRLMALSLRMRELRLFDRANALEGLVHQVSRRSLVMTSEKTESGFAGQQV